MSKKNSINFKKYKQQRQHTFDHKTYQKLIMKPEKKSIPSNLKKKKNLNQNRNKK